MAIDPVSAGLQGASLLASLFGGSGQPELPPEMQRLYRYLMKISRDRLHYAKGIPGSDPQEQAALAQSRALAGNELGQQYEGLLAALGTGNANQGDALANFRSGAGGTLAGIDANALLGFLANRQKAYMEAAQIGGMAAGPGSAYGPQQGGQTDLAGVFGNLAQTYAYQKALNSYRAPASGVKYDPIRPPEPKLNPGYQFPQPDYPD